MWKASRQLSTVVLHKNAAKASPAVSFTKSLLQKESLKKEAYQFGFEPREMDGVPEVVKKIMSLSNGNAKQERKANIKNTIKMFKGHEADCGSYEVQCTILCKC